MNIENDKHQEEDCLLCETTGEAMDMLNANKDSKIKNKKSSQKIKIILWCLVIIFGVVGIYKVLSSSSLTNSVTKGDSIQGQLINIIEKTNPQINALAPDFALEDIFGDSVSLSSFRGGKPVLLVFWATWCGYCAEELPDLKIFTQRYQDKIQIIAIVSSEPKQTIKDYIEKKDINFLILLDEKREIWNQYLVRGTPSHFLISKNGRIVTLRPGLSSLADLEIMLSMILIE